MKNQTEETIIPVAPQPIQTKLSSTDTDKTDNIPLVSLSRIWSPTDNLNLYVINNDGTKLIHVTTKEIKELETEVPLLDILKGSVQSSIDSEVLANIRRFFLIKKQIGFEKQPPYEFFNKNDEQKLYKLSMYQRIQEDYDNSKELTKF